MLAKTRYGYGHADALVRQHQSLRDPGTGKELPAIRIDAVWRKSQTGSDLAILTAAEAYQLIDQIKATLKAMGVTKDPRSNRKSKKVLAAESAYRNRAKQCAREGELEVDDNAKVSMHDPAEGAYVQAWVWVSSEDL